MPAQLVQVLLAHGLLPQEKAEDALRHQAMSGGLVDTALLERRLLSEPEVLEALGDAAGLRPVNLADFEPNADVASFIPPKIAERLCVVPLSLDGNTLHVACGYPVPQKELEEVGFLLGKPLELWVGIEARVREWISIIYEQPLAPRYKDLLVELEEERQEEPLPLDEPLEESLDEPVAESEQPEAPPAPSEESLTVDMVERLAQSVANEPVPQEEQRREPATTPVPPPAYTREPLRLNMPAEPAPPHVPPEPRTPEPPPPAPPPPASPPPAPPPPAPRPPVRDEVPEWTLAQARDALKEATKDRDRLIDTALRFGRRTFDYVAAFAVLRGAAVGLEVRGEGMGQDELSKVSIPLDAASVFRTVAVTRGSYAGPLPPDSLTKHYLELFGRQTPRIVFLYPVEVRGRLVAILYGDCGQKPISQRRLSDFILFCQELPGAFQELILFRKQRLGELGNSLDFDVDVVEEPLARAPAPAPAMAAGLGWSPFVTRSANALGRAASLAPLVQSQEERPPPDFGPLLKRLTGPDAAQRASAIAELARSPEASAKVLAQHFPGPTAWSRLPVDELPEADELGPIPGALSRLGRPAAQVLAPLMDSGDADTRYFALLTAGNLPYVELVDGVLRSLFDYEPDISSAARVAAAALKHLPRLDAARKDLRQELASRDPLRRSLAARALGTLHDRESIEGLINLTGNDDGMCAQAASEALREVTRATHGVDRRAWTGWWAENRGRRRADWLVAALSHPELDIRLAAIEELSRVLHDTLGYYADAAAPEREAAVRRWEAAVAEPSRARRLSLL